MFGCWTEIADPLPFRPAKPAVLPSFVTTTAEANPAVLTALVAVAEKLRRKLRAAVSSRAFAPRPAFWRMIFAAKRRKRTQNEDGDAEEAF
jgi:hypothetical protein